MNVARMEQWPYLKFGAMVANHQQTVVKQTGEIVYVVLPGQQKILCGLKTIPRKKSSDTDADDVKKHFPPVRKNRGNLFFTNVCGFSECE